MRLVPIQIQEDNMRIPLQCSLLITVFYDGPYIIQNTLCSIALEWTDHWRKIWSIQGKWSKYLLKVHRNLLSICIKHSIQQMDGHLPPLWAEIQLNLFANREVQLALHRMQDEINFIHNENTAKISSD
jgi:hypothetical protein